MQFFSEDYLMHYGIKGMKWKKKKGNEEFKNPNEYLGDAYPQVSPEGWRRGVDLRNGGSGAKRSRDHIRMMLNETSGSRNGNIYRKYKRMYSIADANRRSDQKKARAAAYKKNQKRIAKQQRKAKVSNALKRVKNKIFVDTSGSTKVGKHLYVEHH